MLAMISTLLSRRNASIFDRVYNSRTMYCESCGSQNSDSARFCRKCGLELAGEEETRVAKRLAEMPVPIADEDTIFAISPTLVFVKLGYMLAAIGAILVVALVSILLPA